MSFLEFFLYVGAISANFRFFGKFDRSTELLTEPKRKGVRKSDSWVALLVSRICNSFLISLIVTDAFLNENLFSGCISLMAVMLR